MPDMQLLKEETYKGVRIQFYKYLGGPISGYLVRALNKTYIGAKIMNPPPYFGPRWFNSKEQALEIIKPIIDADIVRRQRTYAYQDFHIELVRYKQGQRYVYKFIITNKDKAPPHGKSGYGYTTKEQAIQRAKFEIDTTVQANKEKFVKKYGFLPGTSTNMVRDRRKRRRR